MLFLEICDVCFTMHPGAVYVPIKYSCSRLTLWTCKVDISASWHIGYADCRVEKVNETFGNSVEKLEEAEYILALSKCCKELKRLTIVELQNF